MLRCKVVVIERASVVVDVRVLRPLIRRVTADEGSEGPSLLRAENRIDLPTFSHQFGNSVQPRNR